MNIKVFEKSSLDYSQVCEWWGKQGWPCLPLDMLSEEGFIVEGIAAGWLYKTDSKLCWIEWLIANPESDKIERSKALDLIIETIIKRAKDQGFSAIFTSSNNPKLIERYNKFGLNVTDNNVTHLIGRL